MIGVLTSIFGGPLIGVLGSVVSGVMGYFERKQQIEADKARYSHELHLQELNVKARGEEMEHEAAIATMTADSANLVASYQHDTGGGQASTWVVNVLRLVRPALTIGLVGIVAYMVVFKVAGVEMQPVAMKILFLAEVAVSWWFADRRRAAASK